MRVANWHLVGLMASPKDPIDTCSIWQYSTNRQCTWHCLLHFSPWYSDRLDKAWERNPIRRSSHTISCLWWWSLQSPHALSSILNKCLDRFRRHQLCIDHMCGLTNSSNSHIPWKQIQESVKKMSERIWIRLARTNKSKISWWLTPVGALDIDGFELGEKLGWALGWDEIEGCTLTLGWYEGCELTLGLADGIPMRPPWYL
jgi:hypothetical protein